MPPNSNGANVPKEFEDKFCKVTVRKSVQIHKFQLEKIPIEQYRTKEFEM